jgi:hypothetical protein
MRRAGRSVAGVAEHSGSPDSWSTPAEARVAVVRRRGRSVPRSGGLLDLFCRESLCYENTPLYVPSEKTEEPPVPPKEPKRPAASSKGTDRRCQLRRILHSVSVQVYLFIRLQAVRYVELQCRGAIASISDLSYTTSPATSWRRRGKRTR